MKPRSFLQRLFRRLKKTLLSLFFIDQWVILTAKNSGYESIQWSALRPLVPSRDRYWADPFIVNEGNRHYIFIEEKIHATGLGRIACLTLDADGDLMSHQVVLERLYHLSYPFIFEKGGETYMLPETAQNRTLELYRCTRFPDQWQLHSTIMTGIYAVDATLLEYQSKWWLFANIKEEGGSSLDALHLFHADDFLSGPWTPHPRNPVVHDIRSARPAGRIFAENGKLIRPSQDNSRRYGYALNFNRITKLNEIEYEEVKESSLEPQRHGKFLAVHTFNRSNEWIVMDAVIRRWKFLFR